MTTKEFFEWAQKYEELGASSYDENKIYFNIADKINLEGFLILATRSGCEAQIVIKDEKVQYCLTSSNLDVFVSIYEDALKATNAGYPDLSWATCKQIGKELKKRQNLTFVLLWIEDDYVDNIHIEASGEANTVIGLATRGLNLIVNATEKRTRIIDTSDDES